MYDEPDYADPGEVEPLFRDAAEAALGRLTVLLEGAAV